MSQFLIFNIGDRELALDMSNVLEVVRVARLSVPANASAGIEGLLNLRGQVVPVVDLQSVIGISQPPVTETDYLIVLHDNDRRMYALRSNSEVRSTSGFQKVEAVDDCLNSSGHLAGLLRVDSRVASILDPNTVSPHSPRPAESQQQRGDQV